MKKLLLTSFSVVLMSSVAFAQTYYNNQAQRQVQPQTQARQAQQPRQAAQPRQVQAQPRQQSAQRSQAGQTKMQSARSQAGQTQARQNSANQQRAAQVRPTGATQQRTAQARSNAAAQQRTAQTRTQSRSRTQSGNLQQPVPENGGLSFYDESGRSMNIQPEYVAPNHTKTHFSSPQTGDRVTMDTTINEATGEATTAFVDGNTGENYGYMVANDQQADMSINARGYSQEAHFRYANDQLISGTMRYDVPGTKADVQMNGDEATGYISHVENGYEERIFMEQGGNVKQEIREERSKNLLFTVTGNRNSDYGRIYDGSGRLIAEGEYDEDEGDKNMRIYDRAAYQRYLRVRDKMDED